MNACDEIAELLSARLDGELTQSEQRRLKEHLAVCPACRALADDLEALESGFSQLEDRPAPEDLTNRVMERVRAECLEQRKKVVPLRRVWVRRAAGLAACLALCAVVYQGNLVQNDAGGSAAAPDEVMIQSALPQTEDGAASAEQGPAVYSAAPDETEAARESRSKVETEAGNTPDTAPSLLVLNALPEGAENIVSDADWTENAAGQRSASLTQKQWQSLAALAGEHILLQHGDGSVGPWTVVVVPEV